MRPPCMPRMTTTLVHQRCPDTAAALACEQACVWYNNNYNEALMSQGQCHEEGAWLDLHSAGRRRSTTMPKA